MHLVYDVTMKNNYFLRLNCLLALKVFGNVFYNIKITSYSRQIKKKFSLYLLLNKIESHFVSTWMLPRTTAAPFVGKTLH